MQKKVIFLITLASLMLTACKFPLSIYKKDIRQGNHVTQENLDQLTPGMTKHEVQRIMGSPAHISSLDVQKWHYHYYFKSGLTGDVTHEPMRLEFKGEKLSCYEGSQAPAKLQACQPK